MFPLSKNDRSTHQHCGERHDHQPHEAVGDGEGGDEVVGGRVQGALPQDGGHHQEVPAHGGQAEGEQEEEEEDALELGGLGVWEGAVVAAAAVEAVVAEQGGVLKERIVY